MDGEEPAEFVDALFEGTGDIRERSQEQVAEVMTADAGFRGKSVLKNLRQEFFIVGQGGHAVTDVSGRKDADVAAERAGRTAVVSDGNDSD